MEDLCYNQKNDYPLIKLLRQTGTEIKKSIRIPWCSPSGIPLSRLISDYEEGLAVLDLSSEEGVMVKTLHTLSDKDKARLKYMIQCRLRLIQQLDEQGYIDWLRDSVPKHTCNYENKSFIPLSTPISEFVITHRLDCVVPTEKFMSHRFNRKVVFIIGNGFDMDLGRKTSYKYFYDSPNCPKSEDALIIKYLNGEEVHSHISNWYNLEDTLLEYGTINKVRREVEDISKDIIVVQKIKDGLCRYLKGIEEHPEFKQSVAWNIYSALYRNAEREDNDLVMYNFNFTDLPEHEVFNIKMNHIHGYMNEGNIILGTKESSQLSKDYVFLQKVSDPNFKPPALEHDLLDADDIIIFGHSLGENDSQYFEAFFRQQSLSYEMERKTIHIITFDDKSEVDIKVSLQKMTEYHLTSLMCRNNVKILRTKTFYDHDPQEVNEFREILSHYIENTQEVESIISSCKGVQSDRGSKK